MGCGALCLMLLGCLSGYCYAQSSLCTLIIPSVLRADSEETIVVDAVDGRNVPFTAEYLIQDYPIKNKVLARGQISVNSGNEYMGTAKVTIPRTYLTNNPGKKQYVSVNIGSPCNVEKVILLTFEAGYIYIQTDKPIYTPGSKVLYRVFPLNFNMRPSNKTVIVEFKNPDGITVKVDQLPGISGIASKSYDLSDIPSLGMWTISAKYETTNTEYINYFEVKEYVLPSFEVRIIPDRSFMYIDDKTFPVNIEALYTYGKPVSGRAFVQFSLKNGNEKRTLTQSLQRVEIEEDTGIGRAELHASDIPEGFHKSRNLTEYRLHVSATVITETGGDWVGAEQDNIHIVNSAYKILFTRTSKYFKPGMPFHLMVLVTNPDGSPANGIPVVASPGGSRGITQEDGTAKLVVNTGSSSINMYITVRTDVLGLVNSRQATEGVTISAYLPQSGQGNYLHLSVESNLVQKGRQVFVQFNIRTRDSAVQNQIKHFTYLILSKGSIIEVGKQKRESGQNLVTKTLMVTEDLIPSFRIVAYYSVGRELVTDSIWVDVVDDCMGTLTIRSNRDIAEPAQPFKLTLRAEKDSHVGLVAVDKGVFAMNNKLKFSQSKVWDIVEKSDTGCSPGSGANNMAVFYDAGLAAQTNFGMLTAQRSELSCKEEHKTRKIRSSSALTEMKHKKAEVYNGDDEKKKCCIDGMKSNPMGYSCDRRARHIDQTERDQRCREIFLDCCKYIELKIKIEKELKDMDMSLDRSDEEDVYMDDDDINVRSTFPESWLWSVVKMTNAADANGISTQVLDRYLRDSITTWEVLAVGMSQTNGICVAKPVEIQAFKNFFVDLKMPYSVVRNEQVEIRAVIYNYAHTPLKVRVTLSHNPEFCSLSTPTKKYTREVTVKDQSSFVVSFVVVPLSVGLHDVEVKVAIYGSLGSDGIRKKLKVVPEGVRRVVTLLSQVLEPEKRGRNAEQMVNVPSVRKNIVPGSEVSIYVIVQGSPIAQLVENSIDGTSLNHLIVVPTGCAEQNMRPMTSVVIATHYLDKTNQWERIGVHRRDTAIQNIQSGYANQLTYRKQDGSYAAFPGTTQGTWLTAYVVKVFSMAKKLTNIDSDILCGSVKWLIMKMQKPDGMFEERIAYSKQYFKGGVANSSDPEVAITAFVAISLLESQEFCSASVSNLQFSINKAIQYISDHYRSLRRPHSVALTAYALARAGKLRDSNKLMSAATDKTHWREPNSREVTLEATSYALLTLLIQKEYQLAHPIARWLTEARFYGHAYGSTQATMMLFQALAKYQEDAASPKALNMKVSVHLPERQNSDEFVFYEKDALKTRSTMTTKNKDFVVKANGEGQSSLTVTAMYYEIVTEKDNECGDFEQTVTVADEPYAKRPDGALGTISIEVCFRYLGKNQSLTNSIVDISMMTGYSPDIEELKRLQDGIDKYISKFEINKGNNDKGTLIIYLDQIFNKETECLKVYAHRYFNVALAQPGSVSIYDYYTPETRCTKFYHTENEGEELGRICQGHVCRCAEGNCLMPQQMGEKQTAMQRKEVACKAGMDYVYRTTLVEIQEAKDYDRYIMQIKDVFKSGTDAAAKKGQKRTFISHVKCRKNLELKRGLDYIVYGTFKDIWHTETSGYTYIIGSDSWIEWWPNDRECQKDEHEPICDIFHQLSQDLVMFGCEQ